MLDMHKETLSVFCQIQFKNINSNNNEQLILVLNLNNKN